MAWPPLTDTQQQAVDVLVASRRLQVVPADVERARAFIGHAEDAIADLPHLTRTPNRYNLAYDACHDLGEALLAGYGYRTGNGAGQHEAVGRFLRIVLDSPPGVREAHRFDRLRRARNRQRYEATPVGEAEAGLAGDTARGLFAALAARGLA